MTTKKTGAAFNRGGSRQDYQTDPRFIAAVQHRFGPIDFDLAASAENTQCERFFTSNENALEMDWTLPVPNGLLWLNPPYNWITPWAAKCAETMVHAREIVPMPTMRILLLMPAAVGSNWFADHVHGKALVFALRPRLIFVGETDPYLRDLVLAMYGVAPGFDCWRWL